VGSGLDITAGRLNHQSAYVEENNDFSKSDIENEAGKVPPSVGGGT